MIGLSIFHTTTQLSYCTWTAVKPTFCLYGLSVLRLLHGFFCVLTHFN